MPLLNVSHSEVTQNLTDFQLDLLKNPYALYTDKKALLVTYFNLNTTRSTLDDALKIPYSNLGKNSPLRFNKITDFYIYGIDRISTNMSNGEFGMESDDIGGDGIILPNTIHPYPGDYFIINMVKDKKYLFQVKGVTGDTFENGNNFWKIEYKLEQVYDDKLEKLVVSEYKFHTGTVGTNFSSVIKKTSWDLAKMMDDLSVALKQYYTSLFYNKKVQTYTFVNLYDNTCNKTQFASRFYDPFLIEFIIKNKVLANIGQNFTYIDHKTKLRPDFPIKYNKSIWRILETRDIYNLSTSRMRSSASIIDDISTIFSTRYEDYFELLYDETDSVTDIYNPPIFILDQQVVGFITNKQLFDQASKYAKYNIMVKYFNDMEIGVEDIIPFEDIIETDNTKENYFYLPMLIFILDKYVKMFISPNNEL
jgi:hypothetical protein|nr:MAG TPA: hypothetical protein [Caudoviricetes sp.]